MKRKELTISERVDLLLKHGVDKPQKWATVHGYQDLAERETPVSGDAWQEEYWDLRKHHLAETEFLFEMLRELVNRVELMDEQMASIVVDPSMEDD